MRTTTLLRLALSGGRTDRLRIILTIFGTTVAALLLMAAVNVADIATLGPPGPPPGMVAANFNDGSSMLGTPAELDDEITQRAKLHNIEIDQVNFQQWSPESSDGFYFHSYGRYQSALLDEPGLHIGVIITGLALLVPLVLFLGQCARIGAPGRDRRLAAFRMAGATPRQAAKIAVIESALAALVGAVTGVSIFVGLRTLDPQTVDDQGRLRWPTDIAIPIWQYGAVVITLAALAAVGTRAALRKVTISPFGILRRRPTTAPGRVPIALFAIGNTIMLSAHTLTRYSESLGVITGVAFAGFVMALIGLTVGSAAIAQRIGRVLIKSTNSPAVLLAARRADSEPYQASRPAAAVLLAVLMASTVTQLRVSFLGPKNIEEPMYTSTFDLLNLVLVFAMAFSVAGLTIVVAESVVTRRRTLAALVASGAPRPIVARSILIEAVIAIVPLTPFAALAGTVAARSYFYCFGEIAVPWVSLGIIMFGTVAAAISVAAIGLIALPASTSPTELRTAT